MKKLLFGLAIILSCYAAKAQSLTVNNMTNGDLYFTVITLQPSMCNVLPEYMVFMVPANTPGFVVNLTNPANWNGGSIPTSFDIGFAAVSRDPSCAGPASWGSVSSTLCSVGTTHYNVVKVGTSSCGYPTSDCIEMSLSAPNCSGFNNSDLVSVQYTAVGTAVTYDCL